MSKLTIAVDNEHLFTNLSQKSGVQSGVYTYTSGQQTFRGEFNKNKISNFVKSMGEIGFQWIWMKLGK